MEISNEQIKKDIVNQLYWDQMVDASDVMVEVSDGKVTLSGTVPSYSARQAAYNDAVIIPGVYLMDNRLGVQAPPVLPPITDDEIRMRAESILDWNADIDAAAIIVTVQAGRVNLSGHVDAYWKRIKAEELVSNLFGVLEVDNAITVVPTDGYRDTLIADDIIATLERSTDIDINNVEIKVENGVVTLSGNVPNWSALRSAEDIARYTGGVVEVINDLSPGEL